MDVIYPWSTIPEAYLKHYLWCISISLSYPWWVSLSYPWCISLSLTLSPSTALFSALPHEFFLCLLGFCFPFHWMSDCYTELHNEFLVISCSPALPNEFFLSLPPRWVAFPVLFYCEPFPDYRMLLWAFPFEGLSFRSFLSVCFCYPLLFYF